MQLRSLTFCMTAGACQMLLASLAGCGSPDTADIFGSSGDGSGNAGSGASGATGTGASSSGGSATGGSNTGATGTGAGSTTGGSSNGGGAVGGSAVGGGAVGGSGGSPSPSDKLACGNQTCPLGANNACCWDEYELHGPPKAECVVGSPQSDGCETHLGNDGLETRIECQLPSHCNTGICCARREFFGGNQAYYSDLECANACSWPDVTVCDPVTPACPIVDGDGGQPIQTVCKASELLPFGYYVCGIP